MLSLGSSLQPRHLLVFGQDERQVYAIKATSSAPYALSFGKWAYLYIVRQRLL